MLGLIVLSQSAMEAQHMLGLVVPQQAPALYHWKHTGVYCPVIEDMTPLQPCPCS